MATHTGSEGLIHIGSNLLGELKSWSLSESAGTIETTKLSDSAKTFTVGTTEWSGSCDCFLDEGDTAQTTLTAGASITIKFYFEGNTTGDKFYTGTCLVESIERNGAIDDMVNASFSFKGTGVLSLSTV
jgi:hypothetical protein